MTINQFALVSGMTDFYHIGTMSRLYETLRNRDIVDPTRIPCVGLSAEPTAHQLRFNLFEIVRKSIIF